MIRARSFRSYALYVCGTQGQADIEGITSDGPDAVARLRCAGGPSSTNSSAVDVLLSALLDMTAARRSTA
jgi:hypothetical protein